MEESDIEINLTCDLPTLRVMYKSLCETYERWPGGHAAEFSVETSRIANSRAFTRVYLTVEDSLYDDTFELGDRLRVSASASRKTNRGKQSSTNNIWLTPVKNEDGDVTSFYGGTRLGSLATEYDSFKLSIRNEENELLYTQDIGTQILA